MSGARGGTRHVNSILGLLCREHFPGIVKFAGKEEPAYTFAHYAAATDTQEGNVANRVIKEFWRHFKLEDGIDQDYADTVVAASARMRVNEMHYDVRVQTVINYYATRLGQRKTKVEAREIDLTREQYMDEEMRAWWCANCPDAWEAMVDKWLDPVFREAHRAAQERRRRMPDVAHHQGNRSLSGYAQAWSAAHGGQPCSLFTAYGMSHKGPASSDVSFSVDDPPQAYTNAGVYDKVTAYA